jgi:hypothetical protein
MSQITIAFRNSIPRIAFWDHNAAINYAIRMHRSGCSHELQFETLDLVPFEDQLVAEQVQGKWLYDGLATAKTTEYPRLLVQLV